MLGHKAKSAIAQVFRAPGLFEACYRALGRRLGSNYLRIVNYHSTPPAMSDSLESHLQFYARFYRNVSRDDLDLFFSGKWPHTRPGIIVSFDDALRSNFDVARPLLEKYGFTGWFMIPVNLLADRVGARSCNVTQDVAYSDGRYMMSSQEVKKLSLGHVVACHTGEHVRMRADRDEQVVAAEIVAAKRELEEVLGHEVDSFCWVGGEPDSYSQAAARKIYDAGYKYSFMTCSGPILPTTNRLQLHRTNIEVNFGIPLVKFQLSGAMDFFHKRRREQVNVLTRVGTEE